MKPTLAHWPDSRLQQLLNVKHPIIQAPMAGADSVKLALAVARGGGQLAQEALALWAQERKKGAA